MLIIGLIPLITALFIKSDKHGMRIKKEEHPRLFRLIEDVAEQLNVSLPDEILLIPTDEIFVSGIFRKRLVIGIAALRNLKTSELKAIIAHEFGHLYGNDTVIGGGLYRISMSLDKAVSFGKACVETSSLYIMGIGLIIMAFYKAYYYLFNLVIFAYSRQAEYRADFFAAGTSGKDNFCNGLINYASFTGYFNHISQGAMIKMLEEEKAFVNIYDVVYTIYKKEGIEKMNKNMIESNESHIFAAHPRLKDRISMFGNIDTKRIGEPATELFDNYENLEKTMTEALTKDLHAKVTLIKLYNDARLREGRCRHCGSQFTYLSDLLKHEAGHEEDKKSEKILPEKTG